MKLICALAIAICFAMGANAAQTNMCHFEGKQRFCEVHDPLEPGDKITKNHVIHMAPYELLDDYERGYIDGADHAKL